MMDYKKIAERSAITIISRQSGYCDLDDPVTAQFVELLAVEIQSAILAEREACLQIAESAYQSSIDVNERCEYAGHIMREIRARSSAPQSPEIAPESPKITFAGIQPD